MPKAKPSTTPAPKSRNSTFFVLTDGAKRLLVPRSKTYQDATATARRHFPKILTRITFHTSELDICAGELTEISPEIWDMAIDSLSSVLIKAEPVAAAISAPPPTSALENDARDKVNVTVNYGASQRVFRVRRTTPFSKIIPAVMNSFGLYDDADHRLVGGEWARRISYMDTPDTVGYDEENGNTLRIDMHCVQKGGKPVIYLFSPDVLEASVRLSLSPEWDLSVVYPVVPSKRGAGGGESIQWNVRTHPDGSLTELGTGLDVSYLFWEALTNHHGKNIPPSPLRSPVPGNHEMTLQNSFSPTTCDLSPVDSVLLSVPDMTPYLDKALLALGLHTEARTSFITYWLPSFLKHAHVALRFVPQAAYEAVARLDIVPAPDVVTRVFMVFKGVSAEELGAWSASVSVEDPARWRSVVGVEVERALDSSLFRVLEWGGMEVLGR
ncbi:hypothetical protein B0H11DRAFT_2174970 [Mycena galericulata]|nr:hypothetical protein B0H11DRAFT_2174970 [Mycena galericulata]